MKKFDIRNGMALAALAFAGAFIATPTVSLAQTAETLSPGSNHPSGTTNVSGTGFGATEAVDIFFDTTDEQLAVTGSNGAFAATPIQVPAGALPGTHYITAIGRRTGDAAQKSFNVTTNWPRYGEGTHNQGGNLYENVLSPATVPGLDILWSYSTGNQVLSSPAIYDGRLYAGSFTGKLYALNPTTGASDWTAATGSFIISSPAAANGNVYVGSYDDDVYAFNATTGATAWTYKTGGSVEASPNVANGVVYVSSNDGNMYALNATSGAKIWSANVGPYVANTPAIAGGVVYVGSPNSNLYALNATTGATLWTASGGTDQFYASPTVANGLVFEAGNYTGALYAFDARNGAARWTANTNMVEAGVAVANGRVYAGDAAGSVYAFNELTGATEWSVTIADGAEFVTSPTIANGVLYLAANDGDIYAFDASNGTQLWGAATGATDFAGSLAVANGTLYAGSSDGNIYAFALGAGGSARLRPPSIAALRRLQPKS